jgi:hypothetical protein
VKTIHSLRLLANKPNYRHFLPLPTLAIDEKQTGNGDCSSGKEQSLIQSRSDSDFSLRLLFSRAGQVCYFLFLWQKLTLVSALTNLCIQSPSQILAKDLVIETEV